MANPKIKFETGSSTVRSKLSQFAHDARVIKTHTTKKGKNLLLAAVADDQSPFRSGEHPSEIAISIITDVFTSKIIPQIDNIKDYNGMEKDVIDIFHLINTSIYTRSVNEDTPAKVSLTIVIVIDDQMLIGNVGENKIIRLRDGQVEPLTGDSSWFSQATKVRGMTVREALSSPHIMETLAIGTTPKVECDFKIANLIINDQFLLFTDGISEFISDQEIQVIINSVENIPGACMRLTEISQERGLKDNATVIYFGLLSKEEAQKKSIEEITSEEKEEKKPGGCSIVYYIILFVILFVIGTALYIGYKHARKLMSNMIKPPSRKTPVTRSTGVAPAPVPELPSGKYFLALDKQSMPLSILRLNKKKLDREETKYEIFDEHNELELLAKVNKGTYNVTITLNTKDDFSVYESSTRNRVKIYEDNVKVYLTKGSNFKVTPQVEGGVSRLKMSGLGSPVFINFSRENLILRVDKDK